MTSAVVQRLQNYPQLEKWYQAHLGAVAASTSRVDRLVWATCQALDEDDASLVGAWCRAVQRFFENSTDWDRDFGAAEEELANRGLSFVDCATEIGELAIRSDRGTTFFDVMTKLATQTHLVVFRFLAAWAALNCNQQELCIEQCEAIDQPFSAVHTLHGQALLELGRIPEAIEILEIATALVPKEVLAWFQLAKAYHVDDQFDKAWDAIKTCRTLGANTAEVAAFMAFVALSSETNRDARLLESWKDLLRHADSLWEHSIMVSVLLDIAFARGNEEDTKLIVSKARWDVLRKDQQFLSKVGRILKKLEEFKWPVIAGALLEALTLPQQAS